MGYTNQLVATCAYSDGSTTNCTTTDSHGNVAGSYCEFEQRACDGGRQHGTSHRGGGGHDQPYGQAGGFTSPTSR